MTRQGAQAIRNKILGVLLRQARMNAGKSLKECAELLDVSPGIISAYEKGENEISLPEIEILAYFLDTGLEFFLDKQSAPKPAASLPGASVLTVRHRIIGVKLRQARLSINMSQKDLADQINIPTSRLSQYERGLKSIPLVELEEIAQALEVPLGYFLDQGVGTVGKQQQRETDWKRFNEMPVELRDFVLEPVNRRYIQVAMRLSQVPTEGLRNIAAGLLDITF